MDKGLLFQFMRAKFSEAGFPPAEVDLHMQSFAERYQNQTDEEIEADIRRRGGPTRIAAATVERRNTVLMADADYRAFVEAAMAAEGNGNQPQTAEAVEETAAEAVPTENVPTENAPAEPIAQNEKAPADDPLAEWFSASEEKKTADAEDLPPMFTEEAPEAAKAEEVKIESVQISDDSRARTAEIPVVRDPQTIRRSEVPAAGEAKPVAAPQAAAPKPDGVGAPQRGPLREADMGKTKVMQVPTAPQRPAEPIPQQKRPQPMPEAYRQEQAAIWGASNGVRDGRGEKRVPQKSAPAPAKPQKKEPAKTEYTDRGTVTRLQEKTYWGEGSEEGVKRFRIILGVSAPFAAILLLAYAVIALGLIAVMAALIAVIVVGLVAEVAVGSLVALIAVIYGISQLFLVLPVGLFELGLGIAAIGITMFVGILMYNIAVRLLPYLLRKFIAFQHVFKGFLQDLYYYVKGECYRR